MGMDIELWDKLKERERLILVMREQETEVKETEGLISDSLFTFRLHCVFLIIHPGNCRR